jgi:DNA-binding transcriptional LysR family regulator
MTLRQHSPGNLPFPAIDLLTLRLFIAVCEERSLNRAATRENIALSALSRRVSDMEAALGLSLLRRHSRGVEPTAAGLSLLQHARIIGRDVAQMQDDLAEQVAGVSGAVRLHANTWAIAEYLPSHLQTFLARHPKISVEIEESTTDEISQSVLDRVADIGIVSGTGAREGLRLLPYRSDRLVAVMPLGHRLAMHDVLRLADIAPFDIIGARRGSALGKLMVTGAAEAGSVLRIRVRISGFDTLYRMVEAGLGIGVGPSSSAERYCKIMRLEARPLAESWAERRLSLCLPVGSVPAHVQALVEHLRLQP